MESLGVSFRERTVFVTGGTGFVGSRLVRELLDAGARVVCLVRDIDPDGAFARNDLLKRVIGVQGALQQEGLLERVINDYEPEVIFHLGAQTLVQQALRSPIETMESNIRGTYLLLEAARRIGSVKALIVASSDKAYGPLRSDKYFEDHPLAGEHPYDVSKSCTDLLSTMYFKTYGLPIAIARCGNIYGGGDTNWSRIVPGTIMALNKGLRPRLRSDGTLVRDYLHVQDVAHAYMALAANINRTDVAGQAFNFSAGEELTAIEVVRKIRVAMNCLHIEPFIANDAKAEIPTQILSSERAFRVLGWRAQIDFETGIKEAIQWYTGGMVPA